ncbi:MAG: putative alpha-1,2-mannosidase [Vicingaceae bacterium]|jgi:predicted alpha-1,2-mannosidase
MKIRIFFSLSISLVLFSCNNKPASENQKPSKGILEYVNPLIGTGGHGHTFPGATVPFGMMQLSPDTRLEGWDGCSGYHYSDSIIYGFSHTHLSGTGVSDYGDLLLMPSQGEIYFDNGSKSNSEKSYRSAFRKETEKANPGSYRVKLEKHNIDVRLVAGKRAGIHEYVFNHAGKAHIILDLAHRDEVLEDTLIFLEDGRVEGKRISKAWATEQHFYFSLQFSKWYQTVELDSSGKKAAFTFDVENGEAIVVKVGISAVSMEGARNNLNSEIKGFDVEQLKTASEAMWLQALSKIEVETSDEDQKTIFYTALYHTMIAPNLFSDVDAKYRGMDLKVHESDHNVYTVFSLWDTFRAAHPLYTIIEQDKTKDFLNTFMKQYDDGGILPIWELSANYTGCMIGYHGVSVLADAHAKGIQGIDWNKVLVAMKHSANQKHLGLEAYHRKGFMEVQDESESVSKVLEYAYDDWTIAQLAKQLGDTATYADFIQRGQYYKNMFNPEVGFMQSKANGGWSVGFNPAEVNFNFTEANSWQYSMFVPQDIQGMIELYGGKEAFENKLDQLFTTEMELAGRHQADITGLIGQYAHGNEPSHHMAYLYNAIGKAYKTQEKVHQILTEQYQNTPDGLSGNEDCGQMSAWYVLSAMGFYSVTPGTDYYVIGMPHFKSSKISLENGKYFTIRANGLSNKAIYIQSAALDGVEFNSTKLSHQTIMQGGELVFEMGESPNKSWGTEDLPTTSISAENQIVPVPYFIAESRTFTETMKIALASVDPESQLFVKVGDSDFTPYNKAIEIDKSTAFEAYAEKNGKRSFIVKDVDYKKIKGGRSIKINTEYANEYSAGGDQGLIDLLRGSDNFRTGQWQGYWGKNLNATIDLGEVESISKITIGSLQDIKSWIFYPKQVSVSISTDGKSFTKVKTIKNAFSDKEYGSFTQDFEFLFKRPLKAKYVKVEAENYGKIGEWHLGEGNDAWLFVDEILIE